MSVTNFNLKNNIIFISGTPCTGKTTIATELNNYLNNIGFNSKLIKINDLAIEKDLVLGEDPDKFYKIVDIDKLDQVLIDEVSKFFSLNKINDFNHNDNKLNENKIEYIKNNDSTISYNSLNYDSNNSIQNSCEEIQKNEEFQNNIVMNNKDILIVEGHLSHLCHGGDKMIILRLNPNILEMRLKERNYSDSKIKENLEAEALAVCSAEACEIYDEEVINEIDTTGKSIEDVIDLILAIIQDEINLPVGGVDFMDWFLE